MSSHLNIPRSASAVESSLVINHILEAGVPGAEIWKYVRKIFLEAESRRRNRKGCKINLYWQRVNRALIEKVGNARSMYLGLEQ